MPKDRKRKIAARETAAKLGVNYTTASRLGGRSPLGAPLAERWVNPHMSDPLSFESWLDAHKDEPRYALFAAWAELDVNSNFEVGRSQWAYDSLQAYGKQDCDWPDPEDPSFDKFYVSGADAQEQWLLDCFFMGTFIGWMVSDWWPPQTRYEAYSDLIREDLNFPLTDDYAVALAYLQTTGATPELVDAFNGLWTAWILAEISGSPEPSFGIVHEIGGQHPAKWRTLTFFDRPLPTFPDSSSFLIRHGHVGSPHPVERADMSGFDAGVEWYFTVNRPEMKRWFLRKVWTAVTITKTFGDNYVPHPNYECEGQVLATTASVSSHNRLRPNL
jgi:hypothetical protein